MHRTHRRTLHAYAAYALLCYVYYPVTEMILIDNSGETIANFSDDAHYTGELSEDAGKKSSAFSAERYCS